MSTSAPGKSVVAVTSVLASAAGVAGLMGVAGIDWAWPRAMHDRRIRVILITPPPAFFAPVSQIVRSVDEETTELVLERCFVSDFDFSPCHYWGIGYLRHTRLCKWSA